jgi:hypothetical protein
VFANPRSHLRRIAVPMLCAALFALVGGPLAVVQVVAWGQMLSDYSQEEGSFLAGATKTFSGDAPCGLCVKVAQARTAEDDRPPALKANSKIDGFLTAAIFLVTEPPRRDGPDFLDLTATPPSRTDAPPAPVPLA